MADARISDLPAITSLSGSEEFVVDSAGTTKKITAANVIGAGFSGQAVDVSIADAGGFYASTDVEGALQEAATFASSGGWAAGLIEDGTSLTNWTQVNGSWSVVSGAFHVDATGGTVARLKYNTAADDWTQSMWVYEADVMMESSGLGTNPPIGLLVWWTGSGAGATSGEIFTAGSASARQIRVTAETTAIIVAATTPTVTWAPDVYSRLKLMLFGGKGQMSLDGHQVAFFDWTNAFSGGLGFSAPRYVGLHANLCKANFKNIALHYLSLP